MAINKVNAAEIRQKIRQIVNSQDYDRTGRIEILAKIGDLGKDLINDLNEIDSTIYELTEDFDFDAQEYDAKIQELEDIQEDAQEANLNIEVVNTRINELLEKGEENLTETERRELAELYLLQEDFLYKSDSIDNQVDPLQNEIYTLSRKKENINAQLREISSAMQGYKEAGAVIKDSAEEHGRPNVAKNSKDVMERNEGGWFVGLFKKGGKTNNKTERYAETRGLNDNINGDSLTYYDSEKHEYIAEWDIIDKKGGNEPEGALRRRTLRAASYGQTIQTASDSVKAKADTAANSEIVKKVLEVKSNLLANTIKKKHKK